MRLSCGQIAFLEREALAAFPAECCGLIEGVPGELTVTALHPAQNQAEDTSCRFAIDPALQFSLLRKLKGSRRAIIGCYHSHPNGRAEPSPRDAAGASEEGFLWIVIAVKDGSAKLGAHIWKSGAFHPISIEAA